MAQAKTQAAKVAPKAMKIETTVSYSALVRFKRKAKKQNTSMAELLRDFVQRYNKS